MEVIVYLTVCGPVLLHGPSGLLAEGLQHGIVIAVLGQLVVAVRP